MSDEMTTNENLTAPKIPPLPMGMPYMPTVKRGPEGRKTDSGSGGGLFISFARDFAPLGKPLSILSVADALLKSPAKVAHEIVHGRSGLAITVLLMLTVLCLLGYGFIMGTFVGGAQLSIVPLKFAGGLLASALICLPSLHIFASLTGGKQSLRETTGLLLQSLALAGILLVGFAPVLWIFSQASGTTVFMGALHLLFWFVSLGFGFCLLKTSFAHLSHGGNGSLALWAAIFLVVTLQMSTTLRPLIGNDDGVLVKEKKFFLAHWADCMNHPKP